MRGLALILLPLALATLVPAAVSSGDEPAVVGTWHGSAEEFSSPHIQGRAQVTVSLTPDGRWTSVWRQAGRELRSSGTWRVTPRMIVLETDSREPIPPRLSLVHRGDVVYGTALTPLPEGRAATVSIALRQTASSPVATRPGL